MAAELARHGLSCRIIDKSAGPTDKSKALVLWSRTLEMLDTMGAVTPFLDAGLHGYGANLFRQGELLLHLKFEIESPYNFALVIPQSETEQLLIAHASRAGVQVERRVELVEFVADESGITSTLLRADGTREEMRSDWLIGCDGAHSTVRHHLEMEFAGSAEPNDWLLADVRVEGKLPSDEISIFFHTSGVLAVFPMRDGRLRVIADLGPAHASAAADPTLADVQRILDQRGPGGLTLSDPVWLTRFRINERIVADYRRGRVFLAGDAAHIHSPAGGQGMNTGMQDAYNLAWKLALAQRGRATELLLESYSVERSRVGRRVLKNSSIMTRFGTMRNPLAQLVRDGLYALFGSMQLVQREIGNMLSELSINYRRSPLTGEQRGLRAIGFLSGKGVKSGDRAPDVELIERTTDAKLRLFDLLRGTQHVLLLMTGAADKQASADLLSIRALVAERYAGLIRCCVIAPHETAFTEPRAAEEIQYLDPGDLRKHYGIWNETLYLIRPDGYVGFRGQPADGSPLLAHLERYLR